MGCSVPACEFIFHGGSAGGVGSFDMLSEPDRVAFEDLTVEFQLDVAAGSEGAVVGQASLLREANADLCWHSFSCSLG
jgi:hypothetical protein